MGVRKNHAYRRRRAILGYLIEHGEATAAQVAEAVGCEKRTALTYLQDMRSDREISIREETHGKTLVRYHIARVALDDESVELPPDVKPSHPCGVVYLGTHRSHPLPNQRGQGALPRSAASRIR